MLAVGVDLEGVGKAGGDGQFDALDHGGALATIDGEAMDDYPAIRGMKRRQRGLMGVIAAVINDENGQAVGA